MKALVLSGGKGTRLRPFTYSLAKQLMPVANKPVLVHCLENIREIGVREVGIVVGDHAEDIRSTIGDGADLDLRITYLVQEEPLGLAHCVLIAAEYLGAEDFVTYLGDNVFVDGIGEAATLFATRRPDAQVTVVKRPDPQQYGVVAVDPDGRVRALAEKPAHPISDLVITGAYFFTPAIHEAVRAITPSARGELEITDAIAHLVSQGRVVTAHEYPSAWMDAGNVRDLLACNRELLARRSAEVSGAVDAASVLRGAVVVERGAVVLRSTLTGPLIVGAGTVVSDSQLGPGTAVGRHCVVSGARIEESILLEGARVVGIPSLRYSVVGRWAQVSAAEEHAHRLVIGDNTHAEVVAA